MIVESRSGYHISLFRQLPISLIAFGIIITVVATTLSVWLIYSNRAKMAIITFSPVIIQVFLVIILPYLLGYKIQAGDSLTHAGDIMTIQLNNEIVSASRASFTSQHRPNFHIFVVILDEVTQKMLAYHQNFIIFAIVDIYSAFIFILANVVMIRQYDIPAVFSLFGSALVISTHPHPGAVSLETHFILIIFLLSKFTNSERRGRYLLALIIVSVSLWPFHQLAPVMVVVVCTIWVLMHMSFIRKPLNHLGLLQFPKLRFPTVLVPVLVALPGYLWWTYTPYFSRGVSKLLISTGSSATVAINKADTLLGKFGFSLVEFGILVMKVYTPVFVLLLLGSLGTLIVISPQSRIRTPRVSPLLIILFTGGGLLASASFFGLGIGLSFGRWLSFAELLAPVIMGVFLYSLVLWMRRVQDKNQVLPVVIIALLVIFLTSGLLFHQGSIQSGPWVETTNDDLVSSEIQGWNWYFSTKSDEHGTITLNRNPDRFIDLLISAPKREKMQESVTYNSTVVTNVAPHFGRPKRLGEQFDSTYYISTRTVRLNRLVVHPEWGVFTREDFDWLQYSDTTANRIYTNENMHIYYIENKHNTMIPSS